MNEMIYTIADETNECYGQGDFGNELRVCRQGGWGSGSFPPAFKTREGAEKFLKTLDRSYAKKVIVLEFRNE